CDASSGGRHLRTELARSRTDPAANRSSEGESMKRAITCAALIALATLDTSPLHAQSPSVPSDAEIRQILADRIDRDRQSVGIVVGVIDAMEAKGRRVINVWTRSSRSVQ